MPLLAEHVLFPILHRYRVQYEDLDVYEAMQRGLRSDADGDVVFGTHEKGLQVFASNVDGYVMGDSGVGAREG